MNRDTIRQEILSLKSKNVLLELPTGTGKSAMGIYKAQQFTEGNGSILVVIPRLVLIENWKQEFSKWWSDCKCSITYTTYNSLQKHTGKWDAVIYDECHHLSERCLSIVPDIAARHSILLSATVKKEHKQALRNAFQPLEIYSHSLRDAIDARILPDPTVYLIPLKLSDECNDTIVFNPGKTRPVYCSFNDRFKYIKKGSKKTVIVSCSQQQKNLHFESTIDYYKRRYLASKQERIKFTWLRLCRERLDWLSNLKTELVKKLMKRYSNQRSIVFCSSMAQAEQLSSNCVISSNKDAARILDRFNNKEIDCITAVGILNEGVNLTDCRVGIYASLNSSETLILQKTGRQLRHKNPVIILPYYTGTRDEELVQKMMENYNKDLVKTIPNIKNYLDAVK